MGHRYNRIESSETGTEIWPLGSPVHRVFKGLTYVMLACLVVTVGAVLLVIVGPILLEVDILADPIYGRVEDFLRRMLSYVVVFAIGYTVCSWGSRLTLTEAEASG